MVLLLTQYASNTFGVPMEDMVANTVSILDMPFREAWLNPNEQ